MRLGFYVISTDCLKKNICVRNVSVFNLFQPSPFPSVGGPRVAGPALFKNESVKLDTHVDKLAGQYFSAVLRVRSVSAFNLFQPFPFNSVGGPDRF